MPAHADIWHVGPNHRLHPFDCAIEIVRHDRKALSIYLQRRLQSGYNRAAALIERMEKEGVISAANAADKGYLAGRGV